MSLDTSLHPPAGSGRGRPGCRRAPTDEPHGGQFQVPVGAVQVGQGLHEKLVVVAKVALYLGEEEWLVAKLGPGGTWPLWPCSV